MQTLGGQVIGIVAVEKKDEMATLEYLMVQDTQDITCLLCAALWLLFASISAAIFSCQAECFFVLSVSILDLSAGRSCSW